MTTILVLRAIGESDCESIGSGFLAQPVNAISSFAYVLFGMMLISSLSGVPGREKSFRLVFGALMVATGIGSFLFHGPQGPASHFLHDVTFIVALVSLAVFDLGGLRDWELSTTLSLLVGSGVVLAAILLAVPESTNLVAGVVVAFIVATDILARRSDRVLRPWWLFAVGAVLLAVAFFGLGRTSSPLCDSKSLLQGHALWHLLSAAALWAYFRSTSPARFSASKVDS